MSHWCDYASQWDRVSPPLRPTPDVIDTIIKLTNCGDGSVLQLGVTPELAVRFPRLDMVDQSQAMIDRFWPGDQTHKRALLGNWFDTPSTCATYRAIVGDGSLNALGSAAELERFFTRIDTLLEPGGRFVCRVFTRPSTQISLETVLAIAAGKAPLGFSAFKWILAMQRTKAGSMHISVNKILSRFNALFPNRDQLSINTGWPMREIDTIDIYSNSMNSYIFPTRDEISDIIPSRFNYKFTECSGYEISELCPILFMEKIY